ncbi:MAG TPA: CBS domain-containing protein [Noviherbaspirillum sp.]
MSIAEHCNVEVVCCDVKASIAEVASLMREHHVGDIVVVDMASDPRIPVGIVTDRDIVVEAVAPGVDLELITAGDIMASPLTTVRESCELHEALETMERLNVRRLPVVREDNSLYGIVTADDIVRLLSGELACLARAVGRQTEVERHTRR